MSPEEKMAEELADKVTSKSLEITREIMEFKKEKGWDDGDFVFSLFVIVGGIANIEDLLEPLADGWLSSVVNYRMQENAETN